MTEIASEEKNSNTQEGNQNNNNQEGAFSQMIDSLSFLTGDKNSQNGNVNDSNQSEQAAQSNSDSHPIDTSIQGSTTNNLNKTGSPKNSSASSTTPNSPKQNKSSRSNESIKKNQQSKPQKNEEPQCSEEELDEYIEGILCRRIPPPKEFRNQILQLFNRRRVQAVCDGNYDLAEEQDNNIKMFYKVVQSEDNKNSEEQQFEILFARYQQLQKDHQDITEKWNNKINEYNEKEEELYNELLTKQQEEKDSFHAKWANPEKLRSFTKPSPKLNSMREQERAMAVARMYQQAKVIKQSADRLQKEETDAAQQRISKTMDVEWNRMLERHELERKKFIDHKNKNVAFLESEKQKDLKPTVNAINQIKSKKGLLLSTKQSSMTITKSAQEIEAQSPRTHQKYANFKSEKKKPKLAIHPVTEQEFQESKKNTRSKSRLKKTQKSDDKRSIKDSENDQTLESTQETENTTEMDPNENENQNTNEIDANEQNENIAESNETPEKDNESPRNDSESKENENQENQNENGNEEDKNQKENEEDKNENQENKENQNESENQENQNENENQENQNENENQEKQNENENENQNGNESNAEKPIEKKDDENNDNKEQTDNNDQEQIENVNNGDKEQTENANQKAENENN